MPDDLAEGALGHRLLAVDRLEVEDVRLEIGREQQEVEELGDPCPGEAELAGALGAVAVVAAVDRGLEAVGEGQRLGHARGATDLGRMWGRGLGGEGPTVPVAHPEEVAREDPLAVVRAVAFGGVGCSGLRVRQVVHTRATEGAGAVRPVPR